jgi:phosphoglycerate dehydrogenase-like enzyme
MEEVERVALFDAALAGAEVLQFAPWLFGYLPAFTDDRWARAPRLKVIAGTFDNRFGDWLDVDDAGRRGVTVIDTSRSMTPTVAEYALAMTLNLLRDLPAAIQLVREGTWKSTGWDQPGFVHGDLTGRTVGLAGYGSINRRYAELLAPFRCAVLTCDPFVADDELRTAGIERVGSLTELASRSEVLVVGIPPTPATQRIISAEVIDAMPRGALIIVVTRMAVVEQAALWRRAEAGEIRAAVDVFDPEPPPPDASFRTSPHVLPTPHVAGDAFYCHRRCFTTACADALAVLAGEPARYRVTTHDDQLYRGLLA